MDPKLQYIENLRKRGYTETFTASASSHIITDQNKLYQPCDLKINSFYTYSPETDPHDYSVLYAIETTDGKKGILINDHCEKPDDSVESFINSIKTAKQNRKMWFKQPWHNMFKVKFSMNV
jgi:hypothetical protein